jgi:hypothetical protein
LHQTGTLSAPFVGETATWLQISTRRVVSHFLDTLARSHKWSRLFVISPWISDFEIPGILSSAQMLKRIKDDRATLYVVTRPPEEVWHSAALERIRLSGVANIKLLPELHTKLFYADTAQGSFAMLGSANLTQRSLQNREIGVLIRDAGAGAKIVRQLSYEASSIYHIAGSTRIGRQTL